MIIARVFPRRTNATPIDELAFTSEPGLFPPDVDEVHVSVSFTYDIQEAERLAYQWETVAPVRVGGPAIGTRADQFIPGMYIKDGYTITSRGCPNRCWFCSVWKRDGDVRELEIKDGWNVLDDNLLACSEQHIRLVFEMLKRQPQKAEFTGGLEAARLKPWHVDLLAELKPKQMFFAYDTPDDLEPLMVAGDMLKEVGFTVSSHRLRCYVLIGYPNDTTSNAERRLRESAHAGFFPMAMLWRNKTGDTSIEWMRFQRHWARPEIISSLLSNRGT